MTAGTFLQWSGLHDGQWGKKNAAGTIERLSSAGYRGRTLTFDFPKHFPRSI
jgi:hypothetical protein